MGIGAQQQALLNHWEDLRRCAKEMASGVLIEHRARINVIGIKGIGGWNVNIPKPQDPATGRLWEDLWAHTHGHAAWTLLGQLKLQGDLVENLQVSIRQEGEKLGKISQLGGQFGTIGVTSLFGKPRTGARSFAR